jgi:hypothetical protein
VTNDLTPPILDLHLSHLISDNPANHPLQVLPFQPAATHGNGQKKAYRCRRSRKIRFPTKATSAPSMTERWHRDPQGPRSFLRLSSRIVRLGVETGEGEDSCFPRQRTALTQTSPPR